MELSKAKHKHLVVMTPTMTEVVGFNFVVGMIADGKEITEVRIFTDEAVQENLMAASRDLKNGKINLNDGVVISRVEPGDNDGEIVVLDINRAEARAIVANSQRSW
jgi:hypothetical protein